MKNDRMIDDLDDAFLKNHFSSEISFVRVNNKYRFLAIK